MASLVSGILLAVVLVFTFTPFAAADCCYPVLKKCCLELASSGKEGPPSQAPVPVATKALAIEAGNLTESSSLTVKPAPEKGEAEDSCSCYPVKMPCCLGVQPEPAIEKEDVVSLCSCYPVIHPCCFNH